MEIWCSDKVGKITDNLSNGIISIAFQNLFSVKNLKLKNNCFLVSKGNIDSK